MNIRAFIVFTVTVLSTVIISCGNAQTTPKTSSDASSNELKYPQWEEQAKTNVRLLPKYGNRSKTEHQKEADDRLIDSYVNQHGSRTKGSEVLISIGFEYLYRKDIKTAMYRFNQAWLLDSLNTDVYWGYGAVYFSLKQPALAMTQYEEGLSINPNNSRIITDKATIYMAEYQTTNDENKLKIAISLLTQSYSLNPNDQNTLFKLSTCHFLNNDCVNAKKYYNECMRLGGRPVSQAYTMALNEKCK